MTPIRVKMLTKMSTEYGRYSSYYTNLSVFNPEDNIELSMIAPRSGWLPKSVGKVYSLALGAGQRNQSQACAELEYLTALALAPGAVGHIANIEEHLGLVRNLREVKRRWIATMHFPPSHWNENDAKALRFVQHVITLCRRDADYLAQWMPQERISCLLHGVDIDFSIRAMARAPPNRASPLWENGCAISTRAGLCSSRRSKNGLT